jgi:hypothetical protein
MNSGTSTIAFVVAVVLAWFGFAARKPALTPPVRVAVVNESELLQQKFAEDVRKERESLDEFRTTAPYREAGRSRSIPPTARSSASVRSGKGGSPPSPAKPMPTAPSSIPTIPPRSATGSCGSRPMAVRSAPCRSNSPREA